MRVRGGRGSSASTTRGPLDKGPGDGDALLLAAGELAAGSEPSLPARPTAAIIYRPVLAADLAVGKLALNKERQLDVLRVP